MKFNFEATTFDQICFLERSRALEIGGLLTGACIEIEDNIDDYMFVPQEGKHKGEKGLHRGKVLQRLLHGITEPQERLLVAFSLDHIENKVLRNVERERLFEKLGQHLKEVIEETSKR